jgi:hypothetical protein
LTDISGFNAFNSRSNKNPALELQVTYCVALERMRKVEWLERSHFYFGGDGPNFHSGHFKEVIISDLGIAWWCWVADSGEEMGWGWIMCYYGVPYLWTNHWTCEF